jgi:hypothetical protein
VSFKPLHCPDHWYGMLAILGILGADALMVRFLLARPVDGATFLGGLWVLGSFMLVIYLGSRVLGLLTMQYWVDRDAVTLVWGATRQIVPIGQIERVQVDLGDRPHDPPRPWHWPCPYRRRFHCDGIGVVNAYATRDLRDLLILVTSEESFGLSPANAGAFVAALQERYALGPARARRTELKRPPLWTWRLWRDRTALCLVMAGLLGVLLLFGVFCFRLPGLPADLPLHYDINGLPDRIAPKANLVVLPLIGFISWFLNLVWGIWIYSRVQRQGAYLLWGGAVVVQIIAALALYNVVRW